MIKIPPNLGALNINLTNEYLQEEVEESTCKFREEEEMQQFYY